MAGRLLALTIRQPWAHMITYCGKLAENRTWYTAHRGLVAIHAGAVSRWDPDAELSPLVQAAWTRYVTAATESRSAGAARSRLERGSELISFGAVVAVAGVIGCHHAGQCRAPAAAGRDGAQERLCSPWTVPGHFHIELADVRPLPAPVPCRGMLRLWPLTPDTEWAVRAQMTAPATPAARALP